MQQHQLARILDIRSVHYKLLVSSIAAKASEWCAFACLNAHKPQSSALTMLMACLATYWSISIQQHPSACVLEIRSVHYKLLMSSIAVKATVWCAFACLNAHKPQSSALTMLMACLATCWSISMQQHPLACVLRIRSVHYNLLMSSIAAKAT